MGTELDAMLARISHEIRHYPTPIARCDEQLTELLERRAKLVAEKERAVERAATPACSPENTWINDGGFNAA